MEIITPVSERERENRRVTPELFRSITDSNGRVIGYLSIDSTIQNTCGGGVRIVPAMSPFELCSLARTMTLKYAFLGLPLGGAKAAIITGSEDLSPQQRKERIRNFADWIKSLHCNYLPGKDIGVNEDEYRYLLECLGRTNIYSTDSSYHTAVSVVLCMEAMRTMGEKQLGKRTVLIEGFGRVGSWVGRMLHERGWRIVGISDSEGTLYDPAGLDIKRIYELKRRNSSGWMRDYDKLCLLPQDALYELQAEYLVPCAIPWTICESSVEKLRVCSIVCGSNNPLTDQAKKGLEKRDIHYMPDFVSNCGGVMGSMLESLCHSREKGARMLMVMLANKISQLNSHAIRNDITLEEAAKNIVEGFLMQDKATDSVSGMIFRRLLSAYRSGFFPAWLERFAGPLYFRALTKRR